jgi:hypothetical protein
MFLCFVILWFVFGVGGYLLMLFAFKNLFENISTISSQDLFSRLIEYSKNMFPAVFLGLISFVLGIIILIESYNDCKKHDHHRSSL